MLEGTQSKEHSGNIRILGSAKWEVGVVVKFGGKITCTRHFFGF
jgi:hypothetical protein